MKKVCSLLLLIIAITAVNAFAKDWEWAKKGGGSGEDYAQSTATDNFGNIYITGYFISPTIIFGTTTLASNGDYDIYVAKYDTSGALVWVKSFGGTGLDRSTSIATDAMGNVFFTGWFTSPTILFGTTVLANVGNYDVFLAKLDSNGNVLWAKCQGGTADDVAMGVATDATGNAYITGYFISPQITFGSTILHNSNAADWVTDLFVAKYSPTGDVLWAATATGSYFDQGNAIAIDAINHVYVTGIFGSPTLSFGTTVLTNTNNLYFDVFLVKYDSLGSLVWARSGGGTADDEAYAIAISKPNLGDGPLHDSVCNIYVTGYSGSMTAQFGGVTLPMLGEQDVLVAKYNQNGDVVWAKRAGGGPCNAWANAAVADALDNVYLCGPFYWPSIPFGGTTLTNKGYADIYLVEYNSIGNIVGAIMVGGAQNDQANGLAKDNWGNLYMTGNYSIYTGHRRL